MQIGFQWQELVSVEKTKSLLAAVVNRATTVFIIKRLPYYTGKDIFEHPVLPEYYVCKELLQWDQGIAPAS